MPSRKLFGSLLRVGQWQKALGIDFKKGAGLQLGPGLRPGARSRLCGRPPIGQPGQKPVQVSLDGTAGFAQKHNKNNRKGQTSMAREILWVCAMSLAKLFIMQQLAQGLNECD